LYTNSIHNWGVSHYLIFTVEIFIIYEKIDNKQIKEIYVNTNKNARYLQFAYS